MEPSQSLFHKFFLTNKTLLITNHCIIVQANPSKRVAHYLPGTPEPIGWLFQGVCAETETLEIFNRIPTATDQNQPNQNQPKQETNHPNPRNQPNKPNKPTTPPTNQKNHPPIINHHFFWKSTFNRKSPIFFVRLSDSPPGRLGICILMCQVKTSGAIHQAMPIGLLPPEPRLVHGLLPSRERIHIPPNGKRNIICKMAIFLGGILLVPWRVNLLVVELPTHMKNMRKSNWIISPNRGEH